MLCERFRRIIEEDTPEFVPFIPDANPCDAPADPIQAMTTEQALEFFQIHRDRQLALLEAQPDTAWKRLATHPEYERYGLHILARHAMLHDHWHLYRMEELRLTREAYLSVLPG